MESPQLVAISLLALFASCLSLECYVCDNQDENRGKCQTTIKTCDYGSDVCLTEVKWSSAPYWTMGAIKQFYISKSCSTEDKCKKYRSSNMPLCTYIWYDDWKCSDCCKGDRCNYFVISNSSKTRINAVLLMLTTAIFAYFK